MLAGLTINIKTILVVPERSNRSISFQVMSLLASDEQGEL